jgi:hypothetical protein
VTRVSRRLDRVGVDFDDSSLVANAGLILVVSLCIRLELAALVDATVRLPGRVGGAMPGRKVLTLVHMRIIGGSHIDHADLLRAGAMEKVLGHRVMAPPRWGRSCAVSRSGMSASSRRSSGLCWPGSGRVAAARVDHRGGETVLEGKGSRNPVAALADPDDRDPVGGDVGSGEHGVEDRSEHGLPVGPEPEPLLVEGSLLARSVEGHPVVATVAGRRAAFNPHL